MTRSALARALVAALLVGPTRAQQVDAAARVVQATAAVLEQAQSRERAGDLAGATAALKEVWAERARALGPDDPHTILVTTRLLRVLALSGDMDEALRLGQQACELVRARDDFDPAVRLVLENNHSVNLQAAGRLREAEEWARSSLEVTARLHGEESDQFATSILNLAILERERGALREALDLARQACDLRSARFGPDARPTLAAQMVVGAVELQLGDLAAAETHLWRSARSFEGGSGAERLQRVSLLLQLGTLALEKGDPEAAAATYLEAEDALRRVSPDHPWLAMVRDHVLQARVLAGRADQVVDELERAADAAGESAAAPECTERLRRHAILASAYGELGRLDDARAAHVRALEALSSCPDAPPGTAASLRSNLAECLVARGDFEAARREGEASAADFERVFGPDSALLVQPLRAIASACEARGELDEAERCALRAQTLSEQAEGQVLGDELDRSLRARRLGDDELDRLLARLALARGDVGRAFARLETGRSRPLLAAVLRAAHDPENAQLSDAMRAGLEREEAARVRLRELLREPAASAPEDEARRLAEARTALAQASASVRLALVEATPQTRPASVDDVAAALGPDRALLSVLWSARQVSLIAVRASSTGSASRADALAQGEGDVAALRADLEALSALFASDPRARPRDVGERGRAAQERLRARLQSAAGVRELLADTARVVLVPDGPFGALPPELACAELAPRARIWTAAPSASVFVELARRPRANLAGARAGSDARESPARHAVVLGDPDFGATRAGADARAASAPRLSPLPAARAEARYIAGVLAASDWDVALLVGGEARRERLEEAAAGASLVHLATHGLRGPSGAAMDAALALACSDDEPGGDFLPLDRLIRRWRGALAPDALVVLPACDSGRATALGTVALSLANGFFYAGARTAIGTLWTVDERAGALLMARFYDELAAAPAQTVAAPAEALARAQRWLREATRDDVRAASERLELPATALAARSETTPSEPDSAITPAALKPYADPYFWAGYVVLGGAD